MKILQINAVLHKGSTGMIAKAIGDYAEKHGHFVLYATPDICSKNNEYRIGTVRDHKIHAVKTRVFGKQGYYSKTATKDFLKWIDREQPDIIHLHNLHSNYIDFRMLFRYINNHKIPTVITLHDCWFFTGKCFHFAYDNCNRWKEACGNCPRLHKEQSSLLFDRTRSVLMDKKKYIGDNDNVTIVAVSDWLAELARVSILSKRDILVINNGVDVSNYSVKESARDKLSLDSKCFVVLGMANKWLSSENRVGFEQFAAHLNEHKKLILIGCTSEQIQKLPSNVVGVGRLSQIELPVYYSAADVFANVTRVDSFPTVNLEALSCGTPVVTYLSGGSAECIEQGKNGYTVPYGDMDAFIEAIRTIEKNGKRSYTEACRSSVEEKYDARYCYHEYLTLYESILQKYC